MKNKFTPYIRRPNGREKTESYRIALQLAHAKIMGRPFCVMVQRGFQNLVIAVGDSKKDIKDQILMVRFRRRSFTQWARNTGRRARG